MRSKQVSKGFEVVWNYEKNYIKPTYL